MNIEENKVYTFKLNSGEEIIGRIIEIVESDYFTVEAPLSTTPTQTGLQLVPIMFTTDINPTIILNVDSVSMIAEPREDVLDVYRESITGIKVPEKKILLS